MPSEEPLRVVLAGCGGMSRVWLRAICEHPNLQAAALVDLQPENARQRAAECGLEHVPIETDLVRALDQTRPDLVFDCTVPAAHLAVTLAALRHGCHVLGEKPLADSMDHARRAVAAAKESDRIYAVIQNRRYDANIRRLREFLDAGSIGRITAVYCDFFLGAHFGGFRDAMEHVLLLDMAIHHFDAARFLLGGTAARTVLCHEWNPPGSWYRHGAAAEAFFEMEGGASFAYRGSWCAEGLQTSWNGAWRIVGERGGVLWDGEGGFEAQTITGDEGFQRPRQAVEVPAADFPAHRDGHASIIREFVAAVRGGPAPETACTDNIRSLAMVFAAIDSAAQGRRLPVEA